MSIEIKMVAMDGQGEAKEPIFFKPTVVEKGWGKEIIIDNRREYCGKLLCFNKGASFSFHFHHKKETFYLVAGKVKLEYFDLTNADRKERVVNVGECVYLSNMVPHKVTALEESTIVEISTEFFNYDNYRIEAGDSQKK